MVTVTSSSPASIFFMTGEALFMFTCVSLIYDGITRRSADVRVPIVWPNLAGRPKILPMDFEGALREVGYKPHLTYLFEIYVYELDGLTYIKCFSMHTP
jgi:hypothetical protein